MSRHCRECGTLMRHRHGTFSRPGGYYCNNRNCPESPLFRYKTLKGELFIGYLRALKLQHKVSDDV